MLLVNATFFVNNYTHACTRMHTYTHKHLYMATRSLKPLLAQNEAIEVIIQCKLSSAFFPAVQTLCVSIYL